jgi:hypothetical protein
MAFDKQQQKLYFKPKHGQKEHIKKKIPLESGTSYPKSYLSALKKKRKKRKKRRGKIYDK